MRALFFRLCSALLCSIFLLFNCSHLNKKSSDSNSSSSETFEANNKPIGTVVHVQTGLNVRNGPSSRFGVCGLLRPGDRFRIDEEKGNWCRITQANSNGDPVTGWVYQKYVARIGRSDAVVKQPAAGQNRQEKVQDSNPGKSQDSSEQREKPAGTLTKEDVTEGAAYVAAGSLIGLPFLILASKIVEGSKTLIKKACVANKRSNFKTDADFLEACVAELAKYKESAKANNENLARLIDQCKAEHKKSAPDPQTSKVLEERMAFIDEFIGASKDEIAEQKENLSKYPDCDAQTLALKNEITDTEAELADLRRHREELEAIKDR